MRVTKIEVQPKPTPTGTAIVAGREIALPLTAGEALQKVGMETGNYAVVDSSGNVLRSSEKLREEEEYEIVPILEGG